jgi:hypothetical protein
MVSAGYEPIIRPDASMRLGWPMIWTCASLVSLSVGMALLTAALYIP